MVISSHRTGAGNSAGILTFIGRGYSEEFIEHMTLVKKQLTTNPRTPIKLVSGADDLCAHCPNCVEGQCTSEKPALFDRLARDKLGRNTPSTLIGIPESLHITEDLIASCCPGCEWRGLCKIVYGSRSSSKAF